MKKILVTFLVATGIYLVAVHYADKSASLGVNMFLYYVAPPFILFFFLLWFLNTKNKQNRK